MTALDVFTYSGQQVRTVLVDGEPWFVAADVTAVLGYSNGRAAVEQHVPNRHQSSVAIHDGTPGNPNRAVISEPGLYRLIMRSNVAAADAFQEWVTAEVLPQIRRTGKFAATEVEHALPKSYADALRELASVVEQRAALENKVEQDAPKVEAWHKLMDSDGYYDLGTAARILGLGRTTFCNALRNEGIFRAGGTQPYQRWMHHFVITPGTYTTPNGHTRPTDTTRVRPSGIGFLAKRLGVVVNGELEPA